MVAMRLLKNGGGMIAGNTALYVTCHMLTQTSTEWTSHHRHLPASILNVLQDLVNVVSSTPVQPPGTLFHPTFMILVIQVHFENDSRMYFLIVLLTDSAGAPGRVV